jgi:hypothetical protein
VPLQKQALLERLVRLGATDVPGTPRLMMRHRSPGELAGLQHRVKAGIEAPLQRGADRVLAKLPQSKLLQGASKLLVENPEMVPLGAVPIPGISAAWLGAKRGAEKLIDRIAPLKEQPMSVEALKQAMDRLAAAETEGSLQHNGLVPGVIDIFKDPPAHKERAGTTSAPWGEKPHPDPNHHSTSTWTEFVDDREGMLGRLLTSLPSASAVDKALINQNFATPESERRPAHSALLNRPSVKTAAPRSFTERVIDVAGRR